MGKNRLFKKSLVATIIVLFIGLAVVPIAALPDSITAGNATESSIFGLKSCINITWNENETEKPIMPRGPYRPIELEVSYSVKRGTFGKRIVEAYGDKNAKIELKIVDKPEWCHAALQSDAIRLPISERLQTGSTILSVQVDEDAPAFGVGKIKIKATTKSILGRFGRFIIINGTEIIEEITIIPDYKPLIGYSINKTHYYLSLNKVTEIPITIENLGNGRTIVFLEVLDTHNSPRTKNWAITVTSLITLPAGGKSKAYLAVRPDKNFDFETTIRLKLTPVCAADTSMQGMPLYVSFHVLDEARLNKDSSLPVFELILAVVLIVVLIVVVIAIVFWKRKRS